MSTIVRARFLAPVRAGSRIRVVNTLADVAERSSGEILLTNHVVEIEGAETPAPVGEILYLIL